MHTSPGLVPTVNYDTPSLASLLGSVGPLSRDITDAALMVQVMAGPDGRDYCCAQSDPPDFFEFLNSGVEGVRLAWTDDLGFASTYAQSESARVIEAVREAAFGLASIGATVEAVDTIWPDFWPAFLASFPVAMMPGLNLIPPPSGADWQASLEVRQASWQASRRLFEEYDLMLCPTSQLLPWTVEKWDAAWTRDSSTFAGGDFAPVYTSHTMMFNFLGIPALSVPCGFVDGLPVGLQIVGPQGSEPRIFQVAKAFMDAFAVAGRPPST
jgi:Asp-tRNA(Asn)/Glu-tRNA(Gln) amidotransferase A subunit family amidase